MHGQMMLTLLTVNYNGVVMWHGAANGVATVYGLVLRVYVCACVCVSCGLNTPRACSDKVLCQTVFPKSFCERNL